MSCKNRYRPLVSLLAVGFWVHASAFAETPLTNADVLSLVKAKVATSTIALTIEASPGNFDTSPAQIIRLSNGGVPQTIIEAMIAKKGGSGPNAISSGNLTNPEEIVIVDGDTRTKARYMIAGVRAKNQFLLRVGLAPRADYVSLPGPKASLRVSHHSPSFIVAIPAYAQPDSYLDLIHFATRKNGTREAMTDYAGFHPDRIVAIQFERVANQSKAPKDFTIYQVKPVSSVGAGEYALVMYNSKIRAAGYFPSGQDSYFDFGID